MRGGKIINKKKSKQISRKKSRKSESNNGGEMNKERLLEIYYNKEIECDHLWIDYPLLLVDENEEKLLFLKKDLEDFGMNMKPALIVHIDSTGGHLDAGTIIYNLLNEFKEKKPIITVVEHQCRSA